MIRVVQFMGVRQGERLDVEHGDVVPRLVD